MKEYFEHLCSRTGEAGRQEMLGLSLLFLLLPGGLGLLTLFVVALFDFLFVGAETPVSSWSFLIAIYGSGLACLAGLVCAGMRRLHHIGLPEKIAFGLAALLFPYLKIVGFLLLIFLVACPPFKNPNPHPYAPTYLKRNLITAAVALFAPLLLVLALLAVAGANPAVLGSFPGLDKYYKVELPPSEEAPAAENVEPEQPAEETPIPEEVDLSKVELDLLAFPAFTDPDLIVRYEGQSTPAYASAQIIPNDRNPNGFTMELTWDLPDTMPISDKTAWDTEQVKSCGTHCKQMRSIDNSKVMRISLNQKQNIWMQTIGQKEGLIEYITFENAPKHPLREFTRYRDNQRVQSFIVDTTTPNTIRFFDIGLQNGKLFPLNDETLWLIVSSDGTISPAAVSNKNPKQVIRFPQEKFAGAWRGVHPDTKWLELMFPGE